MKSDDEGMPKVTFHATDDGSPFGRALCGFTPGENEGMWVTQVQTDVNCHVCSELAR